MADVSTERLTVWTIGHSTRPISEFLEILRSADIEVVGDVRRFPGSRKHPQFGADELAQSLTSAGLSYIALPELGGRRKGRPDSPHTAWRNPSFRAYADYMDSAHFEEGIERLLEIAGRERLSLMCSEAVWWRCHRSLIADFLKVRGHTVVHLLSATKSAEHPFTSAATVVDGRLDYQESSG